MPGVYNTYFEKVQMLYEIQILQDKAKCPGRQKHFDSRYKKKAQNKAEAQHGRYDLVFWKGWRKKPYSYKHGPDKYNTQKRREYRTDIRRGKKKKDTDIKESGDP